MFVIVNNGSNEIYDLYDHIRFHYYLIDVYYNSQELNSQHILFSIYNPISLDHWYYYYNRNI